VAAIADAGGAQRAPRGVMRALLRLAVLGGLVLAGWLLGAGISHADEELDSPDNGLVRLVGDRLEQTTGSDARPSSRLGVPSAVGSTVKKALSTTSIPQLPVQPPVKVDVSRPLASTLQPVSQTVSGLVRATGHKAPADSAAAVSPAVPTVRAAAAPAPRPATRPTAAPANAPILGPVAGPMTRPATGLTAPAHPNADRTSLVAAANATTDSVSQLPASGNGPAAPLPASPPATTTAASITSSSGGGAGTKGIPIVAVNDAWTIAPLVLTHRLRLGAGDLPRSPAVEPSTSPD
jgi:hypothetical protein